MKRIVGGILLAGSLVACSTERRQEEAIWTLTVLGAACPSAESAEPILQETWGEPSHEIDGMHCALDRILSIDQPVSEPTDACCLVVDCGREIDPTDAARLYSIACRPETCATSTQHYQPQENVPERLQASLPECALDATQSSPVTTPALSCRYRVTASYDCSTAPG